MSDPYEHLGRAKGAIDDAIIRMAKQAAEIERLREALKRAKGDIEEYAGLAKPPVKNRVEKTLKMIRAALSVGSENDK